MDGLNKYNTSPPPPTPTHTHTLTVSRMLARGGGVTTIGVLLLIEAT